MEININLTEEVDMWTLFWLNVKKYWKVMALAVGMIVMYFALRDQKTNFAQRLKEINDTHAEEIRRINEIRARERQEYEENRKRYEARIAQIRVQYENEIAALDARTQARVDDIMKKHGNNPTALAGELSRIMGFAVEVPK